jgi:hypothetical protein
MTTSTNNWVAPKNIRIPDFIICGAMKSGTTTLHYMLNQHPNIYIPNNEIFFFDMDDLFQHPAFNYFDGRNWITQRLDKDPERFWKWYTSHFDSAAKDQIIGEDSTTYLASVMAAERIQLQHKKIKTIIMLRHPTDRAYSQYWHLLRTGRAIYTFEDTIKYDPWCILQRSLYLDQLRNFLNHIPEEQVKVVIFEEFLQNTAGLLRDICEYIGADYDLLPKDALNAHQNPARIPKFPNLQILKNRLFREGGNVHYRPFLSEKHSMTQQKQRIPELVNKIHRKINPFVDRKPPKINTSTKQFLHAYFKKELAGINDLLGKDVMSLWFD